MINPENNFTKVIFNENVFPGYYGYYFELSY
jgi:hypothetical protein